MAKNSALVTHDMVSCDIHKLRHYINGRSALVAQGGGQRGIFTSGVLDALLNADFDPFDEFYGTSAGALNICAFLCGQPGLAKAFTLELTTTDEFFNLFSYIRRKQFLNMDWALERILETPYELDLERGYEALGHRSAFAAVTNLETLSDQYLPLFSPQWHETMLATCAIPRLYAHDIALNGQRFVDGGVSASIPVQEAWRRNARLIVVIRTEPVDIELDGRQESLVNEPELRWFKESLNGVQGKWQQTLQYWRQGWSAFIQQQYLQAHTDQPKSSQLNGGRWLFGASNIYRLSHLLGDNFDSGLADMLMVHFQTYDLTQSFLHAPPEDTFVIQIAPRETLKSSSLLSNADDLIFDYQLGLEAGNHFLELYHSIKS